MKIQFIKKMASGAIVYTNGTIMNVPEPIAKEAIKNGYAKKINKEK